MTPEQKAAFINAQVAMMTAEREVMLAEDREARLQAGNEMAFAHNALAYEKFRARWETILGYNALLSFFRAD